MNGFALIADSCRKAVGMPNVNNEEMQRKATLYDFLAKCDNRDFCTLFDSTAFNEIAKAYLQVSVDNLTKCGIIDNKQAAAVTSEFAYLFSECGAAGILERV